MEPGVEGAIRARVLEASSWCQVDGESEARASICKCLDDRVEGATRNWIGHGHGDEETRRESLVEYSDFCKDLSKRTTIRERFAQGL